MNKITEQAISKVPQVTLLFWLIKITETTLGDAVSMSMNLGCLYRYSNFAVIFMIAVTGQIIAKDFIHYSIEQQLLPQ